MMKLKNALKPSMKQMRICKICFKPLKETSLFSLFNKDYLYCDECILSLKPKFFSFQIGGFQALSIFNYDEVIKKVLFQYKGCFDYELRDYMLGMYYPFLKLKYFGYNIVPIPSNIDEDETRGFNHVIELYSFLKLPILDILYKAVKYKQSDHPQSERNKIRNVLKMSQIESVKNKKILVVDDVFTTGNSVSAAIELIKLGSPKDIKVLVMAKTVFKGKT